MAKQQHNKKEFLDKVREFLTAKDSHESWERRIEHALIMIAEHAFDSIDAKMEVRELKRTKPGSAFPVQQTIDVQAAIQLAIDENNKRNQELTSAAIDAAVKKALESKQENK